MRDINVLINKSQLNKHINSKVNFQKMWIPLFMSYSKFVCSCHMNPGLTILWDFAKGCILEPLARELLTLLLNIHLPVSTILSNTIVEQLFLTSIFFFRLNVPNCKDISMPANVPATKA